MSIADERYIRLATRTTDGRPRHVPVWIVGLGGSRVGFTTGSGSWKVRRLSHDPAVDGDASGKFAPPYDGSTESSMSAPGWPVPWDGTVAATPPGTVT